MTSFSLIDIASFVAAVCSILVITSKNPVMSVLFLISVFLSVALYLMLHGTTYLGLAYIIIYVGAIAILFLFVIIILNIKTSDLVSTGAEYGQNLPLGTVLVVFFLATLGAISIYGTEGITAESSLSLSSYFFNAISGTENIANQNSMQLPIQVFSSQSPDNSITNLSQIESIGIGLYTTVIMLLLGTSFIFMLAMVGPIILCMEPRIVGKPFLEDVTYFSPQNIIPCYVGEYDSMIVDTRRNHTH